MGDQLAAPAEPVQRIHSLAAGYEELQLPLAVLLDNVRSMYNVVFRAADEVRVEKLCLCGITAHPPKKGYFEDGIGG